MLKGKIRKYQFMRLLMFAARYIEHQEDLQFNPQQKDLSERHIAERLHYVKSFQCID
jgi:hypothetical protein